MATAPFDLRTKIIDNKTKRIIKYQPYRLFVKGGTQKFERPVGSGNLWYSNGEPANEHKPYTPPLTSDQKLRATLTGQDSKIRRLEEQIAIMEKESKQIKGQGKTVAEMMPKPKTEQSLRAKTAEGKGQIAMSAERK